MSGKREWDGKIEELPHELLNHNMRDTSRSTLRDIGNRLSFPDDDECNGNWESLAEKLGFTEEDLNRVLGQTDPQQNPSPGFLVLRDWSTRSGSTAFVLMNALCEIQRKDIVHVLVHKLKELHTMQLSLSVDDDCGPPRFLIVPTNKSAPLHASLENSLQHPLYWYDITGPRPDIDWCTPSGQLQGVQLTLKLRGEPCLESKNQIYGIAPIRCQPPKRCQPPAPVLPERQVSNGNSRESPSGTHIGSPNGNHMGSPLSGSHKMNAIRMNIPPPKSTFRVTVSLADSNLLNVTRDESKLRLALSSKRSSPAEQRTATSQDNGNGVFSPNIIHPSAFVPVSAKAFPDSYPPQNMSTTQGLSNGSGSRNFDQFDLPFLSEFRSLNPVSACDEEFGLCQDRLASGSIDISNTCQKVHVLSSLTDVKHAVVEVNGEMKSWCEDDEGKMKCATPVENTDKSLHEKDRLAVGQNKSSPPVSHMHPEYVRPKHSGQLEVNCRNNSINNYGYNKQLNAEHTDKRSHGVAVPAKHAEYKPQTAGAVIGLSCSPTVSTLHPEYIPSSQVSQVRQTCVSHSTNGRGKTISQLSVRLDRQGRQIQDSASQVTSLNSCGKESSCTTNADQSLSATATDVSRETGGSQPSNCVMKSACAVDCQHASLRKFSADAVLEGSKYIVTRAVPGVVVSAAPGRSVVIQSKHQLPPTPCKVSPPPCKVTASGYIHVHSPTLQRSSSCPILDEEEPMHTDVSADNTPKEKMHWIPIPTRQSEAVSGSHASSAPSTPMNVKKSKPKPCTYTNNVTPFVITARARNRNERAFPDLSGSQSDMSTCSTHDSGVPTLVTRSTSRDTTMSDTEKSPSPCSMSMSPRKTSMSPCWKTPSPASQDVEACVSMSSGSMSEPEDNPGSSVDNQYTYIDSSSNPSHGRIGASSVAGWNPNVTDKTVDQELMTCINEDGNFIVWRSSVFGKYVISVSHLRKVRHYAVYEKEVKGRVYYFIYPEGTRFSSLAALVDHCRKYGLSDSSKTFMSPDGQQTQRPRVQLGHVRLKTPVVVSSQRKG